ncbi:MAG TPA: CDP-alcohol phosphatidyltransferase family protein [Rectinemataceae bacterium]
MEDADRRKSLNRSIGATTASYFLVQCAIFLAFSLPGRFIREYGAAFLSTSLAFHVTVYLLLMLFKEDFKKEETQERLGSINLANRITLFRLSTLPTLLYLVMAAKTHGIRYPLLALVVFIFITDFLDGYVSRRGREVTKIGRMMDSASDYSLLVVLTLVFRYYGLIPYWFLALVLARLGIQALLMAILIAVKRRIEPKTTFMGKVTVASIMVLYCIEVLNLITSGFSPEVERALEYIVAGIVVAGVGDKVWSFASSLGGGNPRRRMSDGDDKERS